MRTCPHCRSSIPNEATACRYCTRDVDPLLGGPSSNLGCLVGGCSAIFDIARGLCFVMAGFFFLSMVILAFTSRPLNYGQVIVLVIVLTICGLVLGWVGRVVGDVAIGLHEKGKW